MPSPKPHRLTPDTTQTRISEKIKESYCPAEPFFFLQQQRRQNSADTEKLQAPGHSGVSSPRLCSPQALIPLPKYCTSGTLSLQNASSGVLLDPKLQMVYCLCLTQGRSGVLSGPWLGCTASSCIQFRNVPCLA